MIWGFIIGVVVGVLFKPQIMTLVNRGVRLIKENTSTTDDENRF